jgi:hypothetical protein
MEMTKISSRRAVSVALTLAGWLVSASAAAAPSDSQAERVTLTGLTAISVEVEGLPPVAEKNGLTNANLQADAERRLRQAGIPVTSDADAYLYVHVTVADPGGASPLPYYVEVTLMQEVTLPRGLKTRTPLQCPTWWLNRLGMVDANGLRVAVSARVTEFVDQFVRAYQSVNPKP